MAAEKPATKFKPPKSLATCADLLYQTRARRLELQKEVDELAKQESALKDHLIDKLPISDASGIAGKVARATIVLKSTPKIDDWPKFCAYVKRTGAFELMQRRLSAEAVNERLEAGKDIPGVSEFKYKTVALNKV
jgi:hypothetical protein